MDSNFLAALAAHGAGLITHIGLVDEAGQPIPGGDALLQGVHGALLRGALFFDAYVGKGGGEIGSLDDDEQYRIARLRTQESVITALLVAICTSGVLDGDADMTIRFN